jgi:predicted PurR-regulated permease PerM
MIEQWSRTTRYIVTLSLVAGLVAFVLYARELMGPLIISGLIAFVLSSVVESLVRRTTMSRNGLVGLVYSAFLIILIAIPSIITPPLVRQAAGFADNLAVVESQARQILAQSIRIGSFQLELSDLVTNFDQLVRDIIAAAPGSAVETLSRATENFIWLLVILVTTFYLLRDGPKLRLWLVLQITPRFQSDFDHLLLDMALVWNSFLRGQLALMTLVGLLTGIVTAAVGLPGAVVIGIIAGLLDLIPSLGPTVAGAIGVIVALILGSTYIPISNLWFALIVLGIFLLIQQIENIWLRPQIMGHALQLHPGLIFVGVLGALAQVGILGALVVVPVLSSLGIIWRYVHARLLGQDPYPDNPTHFTIPAQDDGGADGDPGDTPS